jgi:phosphatidylserine/phosphatidylglycerophosphate/cardiolipin synthase-like enzyme
MIASMGGVIALVLLLPLTAGAQTMRAQEPEQSRPWAVYFSADGGAARAVAQALGRARQHVQVQAAALSSPEIAKALVDTQRRGVAVEVILDRRRSARGASSATLTHAGIRLLIDAAHDAVTTDAMVIDAQVVITGSFDLAPSTEGSLLVIHDPTLAGRYAENWRRHAAHSEQSSTQP